MSTEATKFVIKRTDLDNDDLVIESDSLTIGSALGNDLLLNHPTVSRTHAGICKMDGAYWIKNLSTSNGTIVNGALVESLQLEDNDAIQIGVFLIKPRIDQDDGSLLLEVEKQIDSVSANNRGTQILGGPMQAQASGKTAMLNPDMLKMLGIQLPGMPGTPPAKPGAPAAGGPKQQSATQLLGAARMQRGMTGLLSSIMALPQEEQQKFQQSMDAFWQRRKLAETGGEQKMADISTLRPTKPDPEYEKFNLHLGKKQFNWLPTTDLVRPWPRGFLGTLGIVIIVAATALSFGWANFTSPGEVSAAHQLNEFNRAQLLPGSKTLLASNATVGNNCYSCHSATVSMEQKCKDCHKTEHFTPDIFPPHEKAKISCIDCHTEHKGKAFSPATVARSMCIDCHKANPTHPKAKDAKGQPLKEPHGGNFGYPIDDQGKWTWVDPVNQFMKDQLPKDEQLTPVAKFHYVHIAGRDQGRARCSDCHASLDTPEEAKKIDRNNCAVCHGVQFVNISNKESKEAKQLLDTLAIKNGLDCNSCHPQHGVAADLKVAIRPVSGKKNPPGKPKPELAIYTADSVYRGGKYWNWNSFASRFGGMSFSGWLIFFSIIPLTILGFLGVDTIRRRQVQDKLKGKLIDLSNQKVWDSTYIKYAQKWESEEQKKRAETSSKSRPVPHPIINFETCIGCHGCILACPQDVLGFDDQEHHAIVVNFEQCMEDTGCQLACPTAPQSCVLINTKKNIREAPKPLRKGAGEGFETEHVAGVYLVGDVSGVPLIRNAIKEGRVAMDKIAEKVKAEGRGGADLDVAIIGIGPGGIAATARAAELGLSYVALEQGRKYATIADKYPAGKYVAFNPFNPSDPPLGAVKLEGPGDLKEKMLGWWDEAVQRLNVKINEFEGVSEVVPQDGIFIVKTSKNPNGYKVRKVVLALGTAAAPRKLGVAGEKEHEHKILTRLQDPAEFKGKKIVVVGAGNSAVEAAVDLTGKRQSDGTVVFPTESGNEVSLVVRSDFPKDLTLENKMWVYYCIDQGRMKAYFGAGIKEIKEKEVTLMKIRGEQIIGTIPNDVVFAMIGSEAPKGFLEKIGIKYTGWDKKKEAPKDAPKKDAPKK